MIDLASVVFLVLYILAAAAVFGLLHLLIVYLEKQFGSGGVEGGGIFFKVARVVLVVLAILVAIGIIISFVTGAEVFHWGGRPMFTRPAP